MKKPEMLIDFHVHCFPDKLAAGAVARLGANAHMDSLTNGTFADTSEKMAAWGVDKFVLQNIAVTPKTQRNVNDFAVACNDAQRVFAFGSVHPAAPDACEELERLAEAGILGVKFHPEYQFFDVDDRMAYPVYEKCAELGLIMFFHAGWDVAFPDSRRIYPKACARMAADFKGASIVFAHGGGNLAWDEVEEQLCGLDVYFDLAMLPVFLENSAAKRLIRKHGAQRILFGTDCPWSSPPTLMEYLAKMELTADEYEAICFGNACRLLGIQGKAV